MTTVGKLCQAGLVCVASILVGGATAKAKDQLKWNCRDGEPLTTDKCRTKDGVREKAEFALTDLSRRLIKLIPMEKFDFVQFPPAAIPVYDEAAAMSVIIDEVWLEDWDSSKATVSYAATQGGPVTLTLEGVKVTAKTMFVCTPKDGSTRVRATMPGFQLNLASLGVSLVAPILISQTTKGSAPTASVLDSCVASVHKTKAALVKVREDRGDEEKSACAIKHDTATKLALPAIRTAVCRILEKRLNSAFDDENTAPHKPGFWAFTASAAYSIMVVTWNTNGLHRPDKTFGLEMLFQKASHPGAIIQPDILVICLQEVIDINSPIEHVKNLIWTELVPPMRWLEAIYSIMRSANYKWLSMKRRLGVFMIVFVREERKDEIASVAAGHVNLGLSTHQDSEYRYNFIQVHERLQMKNQQNEPPKEELDDSSILKGFMQVHEGLKMNLKTQQDELPEEKPDKASIPDDLVAVTRDTAYVAPEWPTSKLPDKIKALIARFTPKKRRRATIPSKEMPFTLGQSDIIFFAGDLNYRLESKNPPYTKKELQLSLDAGDYDAILQHDQLGKTMNFLSHFNKLQKSWAGYEEGRIQFAPTFKFQPGSLKPDAKKNRFPGYCDRILWKINVAERSFSLAQHFYESIPRLTQSDHTPVHSLFRLIVPPNATSDPGMDEDA